MEYQEATAVDIVRSFGGLKVLVLGDAILDTWLEGTAARISREAPVPVVEKRSEHTCPGGAANTAANVGALGAEAAFVGLIGDDAAGASLRTALRAAGIDDRWLVDDPDVATLRKLRIIADGQYIARFDEGSLAPCSTAARRAISARVQELASGCDVVMVADYDGGTVQRDLIEFLGQPRDIQPRVLAIDARKLRRYAGVKATVMTPNIQEARNAVSAIAPDSPLEPDEIAHHLREVLDAEHIVITMGGGGASLVDGQAKITHLPTYPILRAGDVGAGDSFAAAMALALASGADAHVAAGIAIDAASLACTKQRTAVVTQQELLQRVSLSQQGTPGGHLSLKDLTTRLDAARYAGRRIVFTNGVFDILHAGHVQLLNRAKALGDVLVVGINGDASVRRLKGDQRPINREQDRLALVSALDAVDHALIFAEDTPAEVIRAIRPHLHVKGGDYSAETLPEIDAVREVGAELRILPLLGNFSTTGLISRIASKSERGGTNSNRTDMKQ